MEYLSELQIKGTQYVKQQALQHGYLGFSNFCVFDPPPKKKWIIQNKIQTILKFQQSEIYVKDAGPGYAHAKFVGNSMIFHTQMVQKNY